MNQNDTQPKVATPHRAARLVRSVRLTGAVMLAVPVLTLVACLGWTWDQQRRAAERDRSVVLEALAATVADGAKVMLGADDTAHLQEMVISVAHRHGVDECAVTLGDGGPVAHSDPARVTHATLPDPWPAAVSDAGAAPVEGVRRARIDVPGHGTAWAVVAAKPATGPIAELASLGGLAFIGLGAFALELLICHAAVRVLRPLQAIQGSLFDAGGGEDSSAALEIDPRWGIEAQGWNGLMRERETMRASLLDRRLDEASTGRSTDGLLTGACDSLPHGLMVLDAAGKVRYANGAAAVLMGAKREELIGKDAAGALGEGEAAGLVREVAERGTRRRGAVEVERAGPEGGEATVIRYTVTRVSQHNGACAVVVIEDFTQQRVADHARDTFVAQATHELRTPLTNIRLYVEMLQEDGDADAAVRGNCINVINQEARRLERMVSDMLSVSEIEAGSMKLNADDVRLDALFSELENDYRPQASAKGLVLTWDLPPKFPVIRGDRDKVAMALHNLVANALKYTPAGGAVTVKVDAGAETVVVRVQDTGIGIAPDESQLVFEKFYRSKDRRVAKIEGTGLGLALAREVARLHGGDITLESQLDQGSTFTLTLPAARRAA